MNKSLSILISVLFAIGLISLRESGDIKDDLIAVWIYSDSENDVLNYKKHDKFKDDEPGIEFKKNGILKKRQNVGWCGTPPVTYRNYDGSWERTSDSTLTIKYDYWGGKAEEDWLIVEMTAENLKIKRTASRR
ncbi:MAG: hypothetical protein ACYC1Q_00020 [Bacteroidia bacterium]